MKTTYRHSWLRFLVAFLMVPTAYSQGETVLVANFMNGNNAFLHSRVYLFNPTDTAGEITVLVFTLPLSSGVPQELTVTPLSLGMLGPRAALNLKLAEDILLPLGIPLPYTNDGGNLTLEFTIGAEKVRGVAQVFTSDFAFGTYPLQGPESISGTGSSGEIPDGAITTSKIADAAVTGGKIANGAVGSVQLADTVTFGASSSPGQISVVNSNNNATVILGNVNNGGAFILNDAGGNRKIYLGVSNNGGLVNVKNSTDNTTVILGNDVNNEGAFILNDAGGNRKVYLGVSNNGGLVNVKNSTDNTTVILGNVNNGGAFILNDAGGNRKIYLGVSNNGGLVNVSNAIGTLTAGMNGSTGQVFGNSKSFIVADPSDSRRMIKYTSVEGPEAAIYVRGTATLTSGKAYIGFPEHFAAMAVQSSITVTLTPRSAISMGLAAVDVTANGIGVAELAGGTNSYSFDYVAYAVRKGFENYQVYLSKEEAQQLTGTTAAVARSLAPLGEASKSVATLPAAAK